MHEIELRDQAIKLADGFGYKVSEDWLDGLGGGVCVVKGQKRLILDVSQAAAEQLEAVAEALKQEGDVALEQASPELAEYLQRT